MSKGSRHVVLAASSPHNRTSYTWSKQPWAHRSTQTHLFACKLITVVPRFATPLHCRHSVSFSGFPRLVATLHTLTQPALASLPSSFGQTSNVKGKRHSHLPLLAPPTLVSRSASAFNCPPNLPRCECRPPPSESCLRETKVRDP